MFLLTAVAASTEAEAAANILDDVASPTVIMMEVLMYWIASMLILFVMDWYAAKKIGGKKRAGYQVLKPYRSIALMIFTAFTFIIGILCLMRDFSCSRGTLSYFGLPYLIGLLYYMVKMFRRVRAETKGRRL